MQAGQGRADMASLWGLHRRLLRLVCNNFVFLMGDINNYAMKEYTKEQLPMSPCMIYVLSVQATAQIKGI
jgi:hypothetical protein